MGRQAIALAGVHLFYLLVALAAAFAAVSAYSSYARCECESFGMWLTMNSYWALAIAAFSAPLAAWIAMAFSRRRAAWIVAALPLLWLPAQAGLWAYLWYFEVR